MLGQLKQWGSRALQRLAALGAALVSPIEWIVGGAARKVLTASEQIDRVESLFMRFVRLLFWPFRMLGSGLQAILPESLSRSLSGFSGLLGRAGLALLQLAEKLNLDRAVWGIVWLLQPLWRPLAAMGMFAYCWLETRQYRRGLMALPAILLASLVLGMGIWHSVFGKSSLVANYSAAAREMLEAREFDRASLYQQKLAQLGVDTQLTDFRTALSLVDGDQFEAAYQRMLLLAPEDQPGYPNAHFWIVQRLMSGQLDVTKEKARASATIHLDHLKTLGIVGPQSQLFRAILLLQGKQLEEAVDVLEPLVSVIPIAAYERMRVNLVLQRTEQARLDARALSTQMSARKRRGAKLGVAEFQWWLAAEELLGNWQQMRTILDLWVELEPENKQAKLGLATVCRHKAAKLLRAPFPKENQIVDLWIQAAELDPSIKPLNQLARILYRDRQLSPVYERILAALHQSSHTPVNLLLILGTEAAQQQQYGDARLFFAAVTAKDETNSAAWNNYGLVLGEGEDAQLDEALIAVNRALEIAPNLFRFRETRGQILLRLERWEEAAEDLEFALNGLPGLLAIHKSLAVAYTALDQTDLARLHQLRADSPNDNLR